jgi:hypothetical protein
MHLMCQAAKMKQGNHVMPTSSVMLTTHWMSRACIGLCLKSNEMLAHTTQIVKDLSQTTRCLP